MNALGRLTAAALLVGTAVVIAAPAALIAWLVQLLFPAAEWRFPIQWWHVPIGALIFVALSSVFTIVEAALFVMFPRPEQKMLRSALEAGAYLVALMGLFSVVLTPEPAAFLAAAAACLVLTILEKALPVPTAADPQRPLGSDGQDSRESAGLS